MSNFDMLDSVDGLVGSGDNQEFESYEKLDINKSKIELRKQVKTFMSYLCDVYAKSGLEEKPIYLRNVMELEAMTLTELLSQARYAEHMLDTLMRRLDAGGHYNDEIYDLLMKLQSNSMDITTRVSRHVRTLPEYFKSVDNDIKSATMIDAMEVESDDTDNQPSTDDDVDENFSLDEPVYGSKGLNMYIQNKIKENQMQIESFSEFDPTNSSDDNDDLTADEVAGEVNMEKLEIAKNRY